MQLAELEITGVHMGWWNALCHSPTRVEFMALATELLKDWVAAPQMKRSLAVIFTSSFQNLASSYTGWDPQFVQLTSACLFLLHIPRGSSSRRKSGAHYLEATLVSFFLKAFSTSDSFLCTWHTCCYPGKWASSPWCLNSALCCSGWTSLHYNMLKPTYCHYA